jgi:hypothetical protein
MEWMKRLLQGEQPLPPTSARPEASWDELVAQARSPDGRLRQAAVRALAASSHAPALPVMLERLNDWVGAIRRDAREAIENFLRHEFLATWIASLDQVAALTRAQRADHTALLEHIVGWLLAPEQFALVDASRERVPREIARLMLRARMREPLASATRLQAWHEALDASDIVLAAHGVQAIGDLQAAMRDDDASGRQLLASLVQVATRSRYASIRTAGLRAALALPDVVAPELLHRLCFDGNGNTRALAISAVRGDDATVRALVARALDELAATNPAKVRAAALDGLCSIDEGIGLARCRELHDDANPTVRATALRRLLSRADATSRDTLIQEALGDESSRVRRIAVAQVSRGANPPALDTLRALAVARPAALGGLCRVATGLSPWDRIAFLLATLLDAPESPARTDMFFAELQRWRVDMARSYVTPSGTQRDTIRHSWAYARDLLPRALQQGIAMHLRAFGVLDD